MTKLKVALSLIALLLAAPAHAQTVPAVKLCDGTQPNCPLIGNANPQVIYSTPTTPASAGQFGLAITSSTALTVPTGATYAVVCARGGNADWTTDGTTTPTGTVGTQLLQNSCVGLLGATTLANFRAIQQTGSTTTLDVQYWKP